MSAVEVDIRQSLAVVRMFGSDAEQLGEQWQGLFAGRQSFLLERRALADVFAEVGISKRQAKQKFRHLRIVMDQPLADVTALRGSGNRLVDARQPVVNVGEAVVRIGQTGLVFDDAGIIANEAQVNVASLLKAALCFVPSVRSVGEIAHGVERGSQFGLKLGTR